ncbi:MAG: hypothetical protein O3B09_00625 [Proteobacteria bacterium]|nr:hypothetical protein [Pseudomonadota bacterium]
MNYKKYLAIILTSLLMISQNSRAEIIDIKRDEQKFGEWKILCETDLMMKISNCKIASKFYNETSVISIEPSSKFSNQLILVIPQIKTGSFVTMRVGNNDLIFSDTINKTDFGLIPLTLEQKSTILKQMKNSDFLFIRFSVRDADKEITARINLDDFRQSLNHYNNQINN